jgi:hypothetical protein
MVSDAIRQYLEQLIGLKLSIARHFGSGANFQFGKIELLEKGSVADFAIHIQCPWRIESQTHLVTGNDDLWWSTLGNHEPKGWSYKDGDSVLDTRMSELLEGYDPRTQSWINITDLLVVEEISLNNFGDLTVHLSGGYRLHLFITGTTGETWRVFRPSFDEPHLVVGSDKNGLWWDT